MLAKSLKTPIISSAADDVNVRVTVTFPESLRGVEGVDPNLDFVETCSLFLFSLSCNIFKINKI